MRATRQGNARLAAAATETSSARATPAWMAKPVWWWRLQREQRVLRKWMRAPVKPRRSNDVRLTLRGTPSNEPVCRVARVGQRVPRRALDGAEIHIEPRGRFDLHAQQWAALPPRRRWVNIDLQLER